MSSNNPTPVLAADKLYEAYDRFVCKECAGMTAEYTGVTIGGYRLTVITTADVVEWAGYDQGPLTCECRRLEAVLDEQQQLQIRPGTPLPRPAAVEHRAAIQAVDGVEHLRAVRSWQPGPGVAGQRGAGREREKDPVRRPHDLAARDREVKCSAARGRTRASCGSASFPARSAGIPWKFSRTN